MDKRVGFAAALLFCITVEAQLALNNTSLPVTYPSIILEGGEQVCPTQDQLEMARMGLKEGVQALIQNIFTTESTPVKVADLNMSRPDEQCPGGLTLITTPRRACRQNTDSDCDSIIYSTNNTRYQTVCGTVIGLGFNSPDSFQRIHCTERCQTIEGPYVDGVSITHGSPREHIWSFAVEHADIMRCPCSNNSIGTTHIPSFVGDDYTCETYTSTDPVWDGEGCIEADEPCCQRPSVPVFCKELPEPTTDDIEVRLCTDEPTSNERVAVEIIELYIQ